MGIGNKISGLLKERNMSASELARKIGVAPTTIYSIIQRNNKKVDIDVLLDMADVLGVDAEYFRDTPDQPHTIAAHFDGEEYTEAELDKIKEFAAFVKSNRNFRNPALIPNAAHERTDIDVTEESKKFDDDIMSNPDEWK